MSQNSPSVSNASQIHTRINQTLVGALEKKILLWLAAHMPAWVVPDTLTAIGLAASFLIFFSYAMTIFDKNFLWLASFGFAVQWFGDSLDGTLARYRKIERPRYGFFVDHIIDSISAALIFLGLGFSPYLRFDLAILALTSYLMLSIYVYLVTYVNGVFQISYARLGPTEMRLIAIITNTVVFFAGNPAMQLSPSGWFAASLTLYDLVGILVMALILSIFTVSTISTAMLLSREDRVAARAKAIQNKADARARAAARRQALRDERAMRKAAAKMTRTARVRLDTER